MLSSGTSHNTTALAPIKTLLVIDSPQSDYHAVSNTTVISYFGKAADDDPAKMIDGEIVTDLCLAREFDAGQNLNQFEKNAINKRKEFSNYDRAR